jgi:hypothetical protein
MLYPHDLSQTIVPKCCNICGGLGELVRDHDHKTGFIRGILCQTCNIWLGFFEHKRCPRRKRADYIAWTVFFKEKIQLHLESNTGIKYTLPKRLLVKLPRANDSIAA